MSYAEKPWLKSYKVASFKLKGSLEPYPKIPLFEILDKAAEVYSQKDAYEYLGGKAKYSELKLFVDKLATALTGLGVKRGDKVMILLPTCPQFIISDFAILKCGAAVVPCAPNNKAPEVKHQLVESGAETIICLDSHLELVNSIKTETRLRNIIITSIDDFSLEEKEIKEITDTYSFRKLIQDTESNPPKVEINPNEDLAVLAFTGGSTGIPKGVMLTHSQRLANILQVLPWFMSPLPTFKGKASLLLAVPIFHAYGHWASQSAINWGFKIILVPDPRDINMIVQLMNQYRPLLVVTVPEQLRRMAGGKVKLNRMPIMIMSGADKLPEKVAKSIEDQVGMPVSEGYGLTETGPSATVDISGFSKLTGFMPKGGRHGVGVPLPDTEVKLVNSETGEEVPFGDVGEVWIKGPQVMMGYWPTAGNGLSEDGWFRTGDLGKMDDDGCFHIVGRIKDMINRFGNKVYPSVVEGVLSQHPAVALVAVIGIPDPQNPDSEKVKAFIKLRSAYKGNITEQELIDFCRDALAHYAIPEFLEFRDDFPMTVTEKVSKKILREEEIKRVKEKGEI